MSNPESSLLPQALFALGCLSLCHAHGGDFLSGYAPTNPPPALTANLRHEEMVCNEAVRRAYVTFGTNQFAFVVPDNFRMDASNPEKIVLTSADPECFLIFHILEPAQADAPHSEAGYFRDLLKNQHPGARILEEFSRSVASHSGPAFDIQWTNRTGASQSARVAFIPSPAGTLEFSLLTGSERFSDSLYWFNSFLLSFRSNEGGKLEIARISDKF